MPTLTVNRDSGYADSIRAYKIFLDGVLLDKISPGELKSYEIASGNHEIFAKIDWCSTLPLSFQTESETVSFEVFSKLRGASLFTALFAIFNPQGWIGMKKSGLPTLDKLRT